ncbi:MAG: efflux RND transporter permease subunit, partial [Janthinobacterium lividum]
PDPQAQIDGEQVRLDAEARERRGILQRGYVPVLTWVLRHPVVTLLVAVLVLAGTGGLATKLQTNFLGDSGQNSLTVTQTLPAGTSLQAQDTAAGAVEKVLAGIDGVETVQTTIGSSGEGFAALAGATGSASFAITTDVDRDQVALQDTVRTKLAALGATGGDISVAGGQAGFGGSSVDVVVTAPDDETLRRATDLVLPAVTKLEGATEVSSNLSAAQPVVQVTVNREAAAAVGLSEASIGRLLAGTLSPSPVGQLTTADAGIQNIVLQVGTGPADLAALQALRIPTAGGLVPLSQVADVAEVQTATSVTRQDGERTATVSATPADADLGSFTSAVTAALDGLDLPEGASTSLGGVSSDQSDAFGQLGLALLVAIGIVYLLMVGTFRSLVQPLVLLVSIPFAATGALVLLLVTSTPLGVPSLIGLLMLVGIVVTNAIVLIDLVNQYHAAGASPRDAVIDGARQRLRPIVMTAAATVFALTPMALGLTGGGGFIAQPLAIVVIGGLVSSTVLTLLLVPVLYLLVARARARLTRGRRGAGAVPVPAPDAPHHPSHRVPGVDTPEV